jgi:hypothetical protein
MARYDGSPCSLLELQLVERSMTLSEPDRARQRPSDRALQRHSIPLRSAPRRRGRILGDGHPHHRSSGRHHKLGYRGRDRPCNL